MKRLLAALIGALALIPAVPSAVSAAEVTLPYEVSVEPGVNPAEHADTFLMRLGIDTPERAARLSHVYTNLVSGYAVELTPEEASRADRFASDDEDVLSFNRSWEASVSPIGLAPASHDEFEDQPALRRHGMPDHLAVQLYDAPVVAVLDTGVDIDHPFLDVLPGFNAVEPGGEILDVVGHGTFVSTVVTSAAPRAEIVPVKVLGDEGYGYTADIAAGLDFIGGLVLSGQRVDAINMSLGGQNPGTPSPDEDLVYAMILALERLDVVTVVSAGNAGANASGFSPANYPETLTVSAIADYDGEPGGKAPTPPVPWAAGSVDDAQASFSNFGEIIDLTAVGVGNYGYAPTTWQPFPPGDSGRIQVGSGTSFSAPLVTAAVARYRAANPDQPARVAVEQLLRYSTLYGGSFTGDPDGIAEPVLWLGEIPRWEG